MKRRLVDPSMPDHMHWYRVIGATYIHAEINRAYDESVSVPAAPAVLDSGTACPPSPDTGHDQLGRALDDLRPVSADEAYRRWLNSGA